MCLQKAQPYTWVYKQELLSTASNKNNLWNAVEKMVERCWNFPKKFWNERAKNSIGFYRNVVFTQNLQMRSVRIWNDLEIHDSLPKRIYIQVYIQLYIQVYRLIYIYIYINIYTIDPDAHPDNFVNRHYKTLSFFCNRY